MTTTETPTTVAAVLNTRTSYTITDGPETWTPDDDCVTDRYSVSPVGHDMVSLYNTSNTLTSHGYALTRGYDPTCYPSGFGTGVVYSPAACPVSYTGALESVNTYDGTRIVTTMTCCPGRYPTFTVNSFRANEPLSCIKPNEGQKNAVIQGFTDSDGVNIITADYWVAHYVAVAYESSDVARWNSGLTSSVSMTSSVSITPGPTPTISAPTISASINSPISEPKTGQPSLSTGATAGIASAAAILAVAIIAILIFVYRRRAKKQNTVQPTADEPFMKAELPGGSKPRVELDQDNEFHEASGVGRPLEADHSNVRAELESDWTGWEAPALLEVELSREPPNTRHRETEQNDRQRDSIQQTPVDMVARQ
ncbi:hypothetical protein OPT61_g7276 [Boeremia exigua]|uniref:Uncharacterized protein n=1 Tax=Boeremia exigua TaxID=749465 RepID=A0ACC2I3Z4_9PLEO|nr:hypothetical protein OPT61_g7276 [Boeremia exigua]